VAFFVGFMLSKNTAQISGAGFGRAIGLLAGTAS